MSADAAAFWMAAIHLASTPAAAASAACDGTRRPFIALLLPVRKPKRPAASGVAKGAQAPSAFRRPEAS